MTFEVLSPSYMPYIDRSSVLYLPTKSGASLLVSVRNPAHVLEGLKQAKSVR